LNCQAGSGLISQQRRRSSIGGLSSCIAPRERRRQWINGLEQCILHRPIHIEKMDGKKGGLLNIRSDIDRMRNAPPHFHSFPRAWEEINGNNERFSLSISPSPYISKDMVDETISTKVIISQTHLGHKGWRCGYVISL
jgi:hypothetical protein